MLNSNSKKMVVIAGLSITGLAVGRLLGREGLAVIGVDANGSCSGGYSKYIKKVVLNNEDDDTLVHTLVNIAENQVEKPVLFIDNDRYIAIVEKFRQKLEKYYTLTLPPSDVLKQLFDKYLLHKLCLGANIDVPITFYVNTIEDYRRFEYEVPLPCIIKPAYSYHNKKLKYKAKIVETREEILPNIREASSLGIPILLQEMIPGSDDNHFSVAVYFDRHNMPIAHFTSQKYFQTPQSSGIGVLMASIKDTGFKDIAVKLLNQINYKGIAEIEFKKDNRDNKFKLIEVNIRPWMQISLAEKCGINFPLLAFRDVTNEEMALIPKAQRDAIWLYMKPLMINLIKKGRYSEILIFFKSRGFARIIKGEIVFALFALDDFSPFFKDTMFSIAKLLHHSVKK